MSSKKFPQRRARKNITTPECCQVRRPKVSIEAWRRHYNEVRPHSSLAYLTPAAFKAKHLADVDEAIAGDAGSR
jgi:hypothetical protein